ncbi:MAG: T9SS type A sorting domain-containing protein [Candidatus Delongbacteria bacterium]|jgi:hypothetical protein|nr:T9SS type A sorting domain-containing protein [Candidatus Delongbacteria bacterium]
MKKISFITIILYSILSFAELINTNSDPTGEKWMAGGFAIPSEEKLSKIKEFRPNMKGNKELPSRVDNSLLPFFRPIFNQVGGSCSQAAGVGYTFTYEINRLRGLSSDIIDNQYPTHFTYNFLNEGSGDIGSWYGDGWDIIIDGGCPNIPDYGGTFAYGGNSRWLSGIEEWENGLSNRVLEHSYITIDTPEGLEEFKNWVDNHSDGSETGGIGVFATGATGYTMTTLPAGTHEAGKKVVTRWGSVMNHAMTYVGYDDSVRFDYNGDGKYTNDIDLNADSMIDMRDWEIGALIVTNSWGTSWGNSGQAYQMYKVIAESEANGGVYLNRVDIINAISDYTPEFIMKVKLKHTQRNKLKVFAGISENLNDLQPSSNHDFSMLNFQGGEFYPQGGNTEDKKYIDFTLDVTDLISNVDNSLPFNLYFQILEEDDGDVLEGEVISVSVVNKFTGKEYYSTKTHINMINDAMTTVSILIDENTFKPSNVQSFGYDGKVALLWEGNTNKSTNFESYTIYRNNDVVVSNLTTNEYVDEDVVNGNLYTYEIAAVFSGSYTGEILSDRIQSMPSEPMQLPYSENFESGAGGWIFKNDISGWNLTDVSFSSVDCDYSGNSTQFVAANSDLAGKEVYVYDYALSPLFNLNGYNNVKLSFDYILNNISDYTGYQSDIILLYRTSVEEDWIELAKLEDTSLWSNFSILLPEEALSSNSTRLAIFFNDYNVWSFGGGFDNIEITGDINYSSPKITEYLPEQFDIYCACAVNQEFSITVEDIDTGSAQLQYNWYLNDELVASGTNTFSHYFAVNGRYEVKAVVSDKYNEDSVTWVVDFTGIDQNIPMVTKLYHNYPNPFNPETTIRFDLQKDDNVTLKIFDSNGALVKTLMNSFYKAGSHSISWKANDNNNSQLSSGVYYYTLKTNNYTKTYKALLFK